MMRASLLLVFLGAFVAASEDWEEAGRKHIASMKIVMAAAPGFPPEAFHPLMFCSGGVAMGQLGFPASYMLDKATPQECYRREAELFRATNFVQWTHNKTAYAMETDGKHIQVLVTANAKVAGKDIKDINLGYRMSYEDGKIIGWQGFYDGAMQAALLPAIQTATIPVGTSATMPFLLSAFAIGFLSCAVAIGIGYRIMQGGVEKMQLYQAF